MTTPSHVSLKSNPNYTSLKLVFYIIKFCKVLVKTHLMQGSCLPIMFYVQIHNITKHP